MDIQDVLVMVIFGVLPVLFIIGRFIDGDF